MIENFGFHPNYSYNMICVFCGYDDLLIELARKFKNPNIVGKDLSWKELLSFPRKERLTNITRDILTPEFCQK